MAYYMEEHYSDVSPTARRGITFLSLLCLCTPWCCKTLKPLRVDIISAMWLPGSIAYFICDIYERMQKMHVPGTQGMSEYSRGKGHHWKKKWNLPTLSF